MDGVSSRLLNVYLPVSLLVTALVLSLTVIASQPADAEEASTEADDERVSVAEYPGHIGVIVQNLLGEKVPTRRYRGEQRFETARLIALDAFDDPSDVVIARGDLFPDALSGSYLAGQRDAPLLLTSTHRLEPDTLEALEGLDPDQVTLVGGTAAIGFQVAAELGRAGYPTKRLDGFDRFETAALAATAEDTVVGERDGHGRTAIVARADEFADALVAGTLSYTGEFPLLLTTAEELHPDTSATLDELAIDHVIVPGGSSAVSDDVVDEIAALGIDVERVSGVDRVATSVAFAQFMRDEFGFGLDRINTAIGTRFADALALGPMSGPFGQPIVLTADQNTLGGDGAVQEFLSQTCVVDLAGIGGGHAAIATDLEEQVRDIATSTGAPCIIDLEPDLALRDLGADHTLTGTLTDNAQEPVPGEDVRTEVYRATDLEIPSAIDVDDLGLDALEDAVAGMPLDDLLGEVEQTLAEAGIDDVVFDGEPVESWVKTTDSNGQVTNTYTGPDVPAVDIAVACLDAENDECVLLDVGDVLDPDSVETAPDQVNSSAIVLWGLDVSDLLPNLLVLEPPLAVEDSGGEHEVTATALSADLDGLGDAGTITDPGSVGDLGELLEDLADFDVNAVGEPVPDTDVRFEVYRALGDDLPQALLDGLADLLESLDLNSLEDGELVDALLALLEGQDADALLDVVNLDPVATGVETTDGNGEADFAYDGPAEGLAADLIVACFTGEEGREQCMLLLNDGDDLGFPEEPGTALAAALWTPAGGLEGLLDTLVGLVDDELLAGIADELDVDVEELDETLDGAVDTVVGESDGDGEEDSEDDDVVEESLGLITDSARGTLSGSDFEAVWEHQDRDEDGVEDRR